MPRTSTSNGAAKVAKPQETPAESVATEAPAPLNVPDATAGRNVYRVKQTMDPNMYVPVRNGFNGKLIYKSRRTGERYVWGSFGEEQDIELQELRAAKTSYKDFFENNWFLIDDPEVISYLGVERYYANALKYDEFDSLFEMSADEIEDRISKLSKGQKASVSYRAKQLIREGGIDSIRVITTLEKALGIELIEHNGVDR